MRLLLPLGFIPVVLCAQSMTGPSPAGLLHRNARYLLQPNDVLEVRYRYTPEFNQIVTVQPDGFCALEVTGDLRLQGLTVEQARMEILEKSTKRLKDPEIAVALQEFEKPYFVVGGEVGHPGRFDLRGNMSPVEAIAVAGGFKNSSKHSQVILYRRVGADLGESKILNLKAPMNAPDLEAAFDMRSGDVLIVPQNTVSKIERYIKWANLGVAWNPLIP
jgi:polysaccharide biosynthesis/export protein